MSAPIYFIDSARHARILKVQNEAKRLLFFKKSQGVLFDRIDALKALAFIRSSAPSGYLKFRKNRAFKWWELDGVSLKDDARLAGIDAHDDEISEALGQVSRWRRTHGSKQICAGTLGKLLDLAADERIELQITSIVAKDDTAEAKHSRRKAGWRARKALVRRTEGRMTRAEYEGESLSKTKPWELAGVSRATWYRRQANGETGCSPPVYINTEGEQPVSPVAEPIETTEDHRQELRAIAVGVQRRAKFIMECHDGETSLMALEELLTFFAACDAKMAA